MLGEGQRIVLERVRAWLPPGMAVLLSADRCYPAAVLFGWRHSHGWPYRRRLKGKRLADPGYGDETTTGELAREVNERYLPGVPTPTIGASENAIAARYPGATRAASPVAEVLALAGYADRLSVEDIEAAYPGPSTGLRALLSPSTVLRTEGTGLVIDSVKPRGTDGDVGFYRLADDSVYVVNHLDGRVATTTLAWWESAVDSWD